MALTAKGGTRYAALALVCGAISAGLALSVETTSLWRLIFAGLAPLPVLAIGLATGPLTTLAAGLAGAVLATGAGGASLGAVYLGAVSVPTATLVWQALRSVETDAEGRKVWYSGGSLLLWLAGLGIAGVLALIAYYAVAGGGLAAAIAQRSGLNLPAAANAARIAPGLAAAAWMMVLVVDGVAAEWLVTQFGLAMRPPVDVRRLSLPIWIGPVLMVAGLAGAALREGTAGMISLNAAIVLVVPFAVLGLAVIHGLLVRSPGGTTAVVAVYAVLLGTPALFGWRALLIFTLMLAGLGSADQLMDFRDLRGLRSGMRRTGMKRK
jgi:hypothetical protein